MPFSFGRIFLVLVTSLSPAISQSISVGIKAGARLGDEFISDLGSLSDESKRYTFGPMVALRLPLRLGIELDALYKPAGYTVQHFDFNFFSSRERSNSWEFPIIAKYRLPGFTGVEPYVGIGYAPRIVDGSRVVGLIIYDLSGKLVSASSTKINTNYDPTHGLVVEGGVSLPVSHLHIAPEIRCTRWNKPFLYSPGQHGFFYASQQDQVEILFGITWH